MYVRITQIQIHRLQVESWIPMIRLPVECAGDYCTS